MPLNGSIQKIFEQGFGFLVDTIGKQYFFHCSEVAGGWDNLHIGDLVSFVPGQNKKGPCATNVTLL